MRRKARLRVVRRPVPGLGRHDEVARFRGGLVVAVGRYRWCLAFFQAVDLHLQPPSEASRSLYGIKAYCGRLLTVMPDRRGYERMCTVGRSGTRECSRVEWTTDAGNTGAQAFYEALGARPLISKVFYRMAGDDLTGPPL